MTKSFIRTRHARRTLVALLPFLVPGCYESAGGDGGTDAEATADVDATGDTGAEADAETDPGTDGVADGAGPGDPCGAAMTPGCLSGLLCVQTAPPYCTSDYIGTCTARPASCAGEPEATVCECTGSPHHNECEARLAGVATLLTPCSADCFSDVDCLGGACRRIPDEPGGLWSCIYPPPASVTGPSENPDMDQCEDAAGCGPGCGCYRMLELYPGFLMPHNECGCPECEIDEDCRSYTPARMCVPAGVWGLPVSRCLFVGCRVDADCASETGGVCAGVRDPCSALDPPAVSSKFCRYPGDCVSGDDCPSGWCIPD